VRPEQAGAQAEEGADQPDGFDVEGAGGFEDERRGGVDGDRVTAAGVGVGEEAVEESGMWGRCGLCRHVISRQIV